MRNKIIIAGITSDIGKKLASRFYEDGYDVVGTYNSEKPSKCGDSESRNSIVCRTQ